MNLKCSNNISGFTIVEVIVAMTLLGTTLTAIFYVLRNCSTVSNHTRMLTKSVLIAENLLTETMMNENAAFETREGEEGLYSWEIKIAPTPIDNLGALRVLVKWKEQQRQQQYELYSLIKMKTL
ncbi:MAG: prepilin-type N-terminal cleavage/methylation domain-containing protein [Bacteroidales bacterium]|nr:prepilin-type N-terminal cleavage/methylation domain-containing protein [Bacteroidales bacterium]